MQASTVDLPTSFHTNRHRDSWALSSLLDIVSYIRGSPPFPGRTNASGSHPHLDWLLRTLQIPITEARFIPNDDEALLHVAAHLMSPVAVPPPVPGLPQKIPYEMTKLVTTTK